MSGKCGLKIQLKAGGVEAQVAAIMQARNAFADSIVSSFDGDYLKKIQTLHFNIRIALLADEKPVDLMMNAVAMRAHAINPRWDMVTADLCKAAHDRGLKVYTWTVDADARMRALAECGVDGIMTNYPWSGCGRWWAADGTIRRRQNRRSPFARRYGRLSGRMCGSVARGATSSDCVRSTMRRRRRSRSMPSADFSDCFGCGVPGSAFNFIMRVEGLTFPEAARSLAKKYGVTIPEFYVAGPAAGEREAMLKASEVAAEFFSHVLWNTTDGANMARDYLKARGISVETARAFML